MASSAVLNIRLPEELKAHGNQVLERNNISVSQIVRNLYEYMEREQAIPEALEPKQQDSLCQRRRTLLRTLAGSVNVAPDFDARKAYREHLVTRYKACS